MQRDCSNLRHPVLHVTITHAAFDLVEDPNECRAVALRICFDLVEGLNSSIALPLELIVRHVACSLVPAAKPRLVVLAPVSVL